MRTWILALLLVALPALALAKPKVAIAPLDGDDDDKVAAAIDDEASEVAKVTPHKDVTRAIKSLGIDATDRKGIRKLRTNLEVDAVIHGKVERSGGKRQLSVTITGRGKKKTSFELSFKKPTDKAFRKELRKQLRKGIEDVTGGDVREDDRDDDDEADDRKRHEEEEARRRKEDEEIRKRREEEDRERERKRRDEEEARKRRDDDERETRRRHDDDEDRESRRRHRDDDDEEDSRRSRRRRHRGDDEETAARHPTTQANLFADAGAAGGRRTLTYDQTGTMGPPSVGTASFGAALEAEAYPGALSGSQGPAANIGVYGTFAKTLALSIAVPGTTTAAPIDEGHYSLGARYRFVFGTSSVAVGASYWRRFYKADRSGLGMATLDMPDTDYTALAPSVVAKFAATPKIGVFGSLELPLMMSSGPITSMQGYGAASILAFDLGAGADIALAPHYGLRFAAAFDQIGLKFSAKQGSGAVRRGISAATDRTIGIVATFALIY